MYLAIRQLTLPLTVCYGHDVAESTAKYANRNPTDMGDTADNDGDGVPELPTRMCHSYFALPPFAEEPVAPGIATRPRNVTIVPMHGLSHGLLASRDESLREARRFLDQVDNAACLMTHVLPFMDEQGASHNEALPSNSVTMERLQQAEASPAFPFHFSVPPGQPVPAHERELEETVQSSVYALGTLSVSLPGYLGTCCCLPFVSLQT